MKGICHCGKPARVSISYQFISPTGFQSSVSIQTCENCGPSALRQAAGQLQAWADVMEKGSSKLLDPPHNWVPSEEDWEKFAMVLDVQHLRLAQENCKPGDKYLWHYRRIWGTRFPEPKENRDAHTEHCCILHGCKYGDDEDCPVMTKQKVQSGYCADCGLEMEED